VSTSYHVEVIQVDRQAWLEQLRDALGAELREVGMHSTVTVELDEAPPADDAPAVSVYFAGPSALSDGAVLERIGAAIDDGRTVIPVVADLRDFSSSVPQSLNAVNGFAWDDAESARRLSRVLLEELGIEDRQRRVFISHKREDGLGAAEQLHDRLTHHGFVPFIDRFAIRSGERVQDTIADALEDHAFLLLLETPEAHASEWVFDEVDYALSHTMGTLILQWPGDPAPVPGSIRLPRLRLSPSDIIEDDHGYDVLTDPALDVVVENVEAAHAQGIVRRRRMLLRNVEEAALAAGATTCVPERHWRLLVERHGHSTLVGVTPRLPNAGDLQHLDQARTAHPASPSAVLVHSARTLRAPLRGHLSWVAGERDLVLRAENAIGGHWT
jgi:hypothetical protein